MPDTTNQKSARLTWVHTDRRGLERAMSLAYARATSQGWTRDSDSLADFRALVLEACTASATLSPEPPSIVQGIVIVRPDRKATTADSYRAQKAIIWGLVPLLGATIADVENGQMNLPTPAKIETQDGEEPSELVEDTSAFGLVIVGAVAAVTAITALAGVLALWLSQRNELAMDQLATDERLKKHAATLAELSHVIDAHAEAEKAAGMSLPWDEQQTKYVEALEQSTVELSKTPEPEKKTLPDVKKVTTAAAGAIADVGQGAKKALEDAGAAAKGAGIGAGAVVAAVIAYLLYEEHQKSKRRQAA